jgi:hypothetical protein
LRSPTGQRLFVSTGARALCGCEIRYEATTDYVSAQLLRPTALSSFEIGHRMSSLRRRIPSRSASNEKTDCDDEFVDCNHDNMHDVEDTEFEDGDEKRPRYSEGPDGTENVQLYRRCGLHPIELYDCIDGYTILRKLGAGGFSTVWLARHHDKKRYVALKIVSAEESKHAEYEGFLYSVDEGVRDYCVAIYDDFWSC